MSNQNTDSCRRTFLFTTHSPYVLTTLNNLAYAGRLESKFKSESRNNELDKLDKIYPAQERIAKDSLSAYYFNNGDIEPIIDEETGLIDAQKLDEISDISNEKYSALIDLEIGEEE